MALRVRNQISCLSRLRGSFPDKVRGAVSVNQTCAWEDRGNKNRVG